jgi:hypothetical protein
MREASTEPGLEVPGALIDVDVAVDLALREAGGGRLAGVRVEREFGRVAYLVQFVRGSWLCTATVDARSGEVTTILDDGAGLTMAADDQPGPGKRSTLRLPFRTVWDACPAVDDPTACYIATDAGIAVVRLRPAGARVLLREAHHETGFGSTRQVVSVPGGVVGMTADGRVFRLDRDGRCRWNTRLPAFPYTVAADDGVTRLLVATNAGAIELGAACGKFLGTVGDGLPVRAAGYLPGGRRVLAGHRGDVSLIDPGGALRWSWEQGEYPERLWVDRDRVYLAGEGGVKEVVPGEGVVCRWSDPSAENVESAVVAGGRVFTCAPGSHVSRHGYATAAFHGPVAAMPAHPEVITAVGDDDPWLVVGHRGGLISAHAV